MDMIHPIWCDPMFCNAPAERPAMSGSYPHTAHHSMLCQIGVSAFDVFNSGSLAMASALVDTQGGVFAWLTQAVAPWECTTYLRIGLCRSTAMRPEPLLGVPMTPRNTINSNMPMSMGERLWHLATHALEIKSDDMIRYGQFGEVVDWPPGQLVDIDDTCGDCITGRCHWGGKASHISIQAVEAGVDVGGCGCARHAVSVAYRRQQAARIGASDPGTGEG